MRRPHADRQGDDARRRCSTSRSRARSTRSRAPAACRDWPSSSTARSTSCPGPKPTTVNGGRLKTTVPVVPDAPIGHFRLTVFGGKTGYLINTRDICAHTPVTRVAYTGQNGKTSSREA